VGPSAGSAARCAALLECGSGTGTDAAQEPRETLAPAWRSSGGHATHPGRPGQRRASAGSSWTEPGATGDDPGFDVGVL